MTQPPPLDTLPPNVLPPHLAAMLQPGFYPDQPVSVTLVQTHISYVFLAGARAYKVKKPVRFAFLDFSTVRQRRHYCHEEVRLNRRLAPGVYRGVVAICADPDRYRLGTEDDPAAIEYAVEMRRLPADRMLSHLLTRGEVGTDLIDAIIERLVAFHQAADSSEAIRAAGDPAVIRRQLDDDFREMASFRNSIISAADDDAVQHFCREWLRQHDALVRQRQRQGRVRECHGDLHSANICATDELVIFDCLEFNPAFRHRDVASDIAFLAMDLDYYGQPELAAHLIREYSQRAGDADLPRVVPFYQCHRAYIRGKVDSLKSAEPEVAAEDRAAARQSAVRHFALAYRYTWSASPFLVVVGGLSGTGKSTVARSLHQRIGFPHINSDMVRKQLAGVAIRDRSGALPGGALYSHAHSARTYGAMFAEAAEALAAGHGVIIDATFQRRVDRDAARRLARRHGVPLLLVECRCDAAEVRQRLDERAHRNTDPSDATWAIYTRQRRRYESFDAEPEHLPVDTAAPAADVVSAIETALRARADQT